MTMWKLLLLWILPCFQASEDGAYECGAHGKFEYCIDGIPGCVIGCHCHPGYYFDTATKICEPNTKLRDNYRRQDIPQPTRNQESMLVQVQDTLEEQTVPPQTTQNVIDEHVNDITKNADDLGDWLYNQFFKTIENQVINKTNTDVQLTRRNGHLPNAKLNKPNRRTRKRGKKRHKKKKKGMKEKLLQIAEDDSLFESSDDSSSSDYDSSSSDSSRSYSSFELETDADHGHKKILMINKKPKPPLPSFIFLPHMNTPFYPPIGLPPPPVMPMYPMVPVPPVVPAPLMFPYPGPIPDCDENKPVTTANPTTKEVITRETLTTTEKISSTVGLDEPSTTLDIEDLPTDTTRQRNPYKQKKRGRPLKKNPGVEDNLPFDHFNPTRKDKKAILQQLRQRMNNPSIKKNRGPFNNYKKPFISADRISNNKNPDVMTIKADDSPLNKFEEMGDQENVDFKYLSQLIHKVSNNQTQDVPLNVYRPHNYLNKINSNEPSQTRFNDFNVPIYGRRMNERMIIAGDGQSDDSYYSNLGLQIASLIRTIDADNERQFNIEIEKSPQKQDDQILYKENTPRTFWERSIRSPIKYYNLIKDRYDYLKNSNELLFDIENKVETVASTLPTLSLQEIENIVNEMKTAEKQFRNNDKIENVKPFSKTLNINLWPQEIQHSKNLFKSSAEPFDKQQVLKKMLIVNKRKLNLNNTRPSNLKTKLNVIHEHNHYSYSNNINTHDLNDNSRHGSQVEPFFKSTSTKLYFLKNTSEAIHPAVAFKPNELTVQHTENLQYSINPSILKNGNKKKYFFDDSNHYSFQNDVLPIQFSPKRTLSSPPIRYLIRPPYFRGEINHVDYIV